MPWGMMEVLYPEEGPERFVLTHPSLNHPKDEDLSARTPDCVKDGAPHFCCWYKGGAPAPCPTDVDSRRCTRAGSANTSCRDSHIIAGLLIQSSCLLQINAELLPVAS